MNIDDLNAALSRPARYPRQMSAYSNWHRSLGNGCVAYDVDFVEIRQGRGIVAFLAVTGRMWSEERIIQQTQEIYARTEIERSMLQFLARRVGCPAYYVLHTSSLSCFHVYALPWWSNAKPQRMDRDQHADFIRNL